MTEDITKVAKDYIFVIPPYFALILRAFSVLEGIGLDIDPDYSIVNACYPYVSKRLLTDDRWVKTLWFSWPLASLDGIFCDFKLQFTPNLIEKQPAICVFFAVFLNTTSTRVSLACKLILFSFFVGTLNPRYPHQNVLNGQMICNVLNLLTYQNGCVLCSPRTRLALKYFLYGESTQLDIQRVEALASGFQSFRDIMTMSHGGPALPPPKVNYLDPTAKEALKLLFAPEGSYIQELILTEVIWQIWKSHLLA